MKGIYIAAVDYANPTAFGVAKKINFQIKSFHNYNIKVDKIYLNKCNLYKNKRNIYKIIKRPYHINFHRKVLEEYNDLIDNYDFVYIRYSYGDLFFYRLIKKLSKNIKVIIEIPTFPFDYESSGKIKGKILGIINKYICSHLNKYVFRVATTNNIDKIFKIETIKINNAIDIDCIRVKENNKKNNEVRLVGIANIQKWHGYDRVINGLYEYYKERKGNTNVYFHIVGEGREKYNLKKLVESLDIKENVIFEGAKSGEELDKLLDKMDIGVSSLSLFRGAIGGDPIKTKEFIGRGFPVILGYNDKLVDMSKSFVKKVSENDESIDINDILAWYYSLDVSSTDISKYAIDNLSWDKQIYKIVEVLNFER